MPGDNELELQRALARRHDLRLAILAMTARAPDRSPDPQDLQRELPEHPTVAAIEYHLSVLRRAGLLSAPEVD